MVGSFSFGGSDDVPAVPMESEEMKQQTVAANIIEGSPKKAGL